MSRVAGPVAAGGTTRLVGLAGFTGAVVVALAGLGVEVPGPPGSARVAAWATWATAVGPGGVVMGVVRLLALVAAVHLLVVVCLELGARQSGRPGLHRASGRLARPWMAGLMGRVAGAGLVVSVAAGSALVAAPAGAARPDPTVVMHRLGPAATSAASATSADSTAHDPPPVMHVIGGGIDLGPRTTASTPTTPGVPATDADPSAPSRPPAPAAAPAATAAPPTDSNPGAAGVPADPTTTRPAASTSPSTPAPASATWTIRPGEHLWRVATATLAQSWDRAPDDAQVAAYLDALIATNRGRLVVPGDPDLVFPGQVFVLPPVPTPPT